MITDGSTLRQMEPNLNEDITHAIYSPLTGIIDVHGYMLALSGEAEESGASICYECEAISASRDSRGILTLETTQGPIEDVAFIVNAAGLQACQVAKLLDKDNVIPEPMYAKGSYWRLGNTSNYSKFDSEGKRKQLFNRLVYPLPEVGGLG